MNCPRCKEKMATSNCSGIETNTCLYCNGAWINSGSLDSLLNKEINTPSKSEIKKSFEAQYDKKANRHCPECNDEKLYQIYTHGVELDLCPKCNGLFFDEGEIKNILPTTHKPTNTEGVGTYVATEGLFWVILSFLGGGC